jgi:hypothetical protein
MQQFAARGRALHVCMGPTQRYAALCNTLQSLRSHRGFRFADFGLKALGLQRFATLARPWDTVTVAVAEALCNIMQRSAPIAVFAS